MFSLFIPNEKYFYNDSNEELTKSEICLVCWLPSERDNIIKRLSVFPHINITCNCNPTIHKLCIDDWISKSSSCPICRKKIVLREKYSFYYIKFVKITIYTLKFMLYMYWFSFICMYFHSIYIFIFFGDDTDIY